MEDFILSESIYNSKTGIGSFNKVGGGNNDAIQYNVYIDKEAAFNNIALWSNPAWLNTDDKSICLRIASEWVYHNRLWMAIDRTTIAEVVGSVRCTIPSSKLATYGDYRYDLDIETLYDNLDGIQPEIFNEGYDDVLDNSTYSARDCKVVKPEKKEEMQGKLQIDYPSSSDFRMMGNQMKSEKQMENCGRSELDQWLLKWKDFLKSVRLAVGKSDPWTDTLLKVCYRFLTAAQDNKSLMQLLEEEMPMIIDYRKLYTDPIQIMELLSLPQPYLDDTLNLNSTETDALWLQLSSDTIRKLWLRNDASEKIFPNAEAVGAIGALNFLRRRQNKFAKKTAYAEVDISEDDTKRLLGSLINFIDGYNCEMDKNETLPSTSNKIGDTSVTTFSEAKGQWNKLLFSNSHNAAVDEVTKTKRECIQKMFNKPPHILPIPPLNWIFTTQNLRMPHPNLSLLSSPALIIPQSAVFQPSILSTSTPQVPIYYMPVTHYVRREGEYYTKCRQRLSSNNLNVLAVTHKAPDQPFTMPSMSLQSPISPEHVLVTRSCNQQQLRHLIPTGKSTIFPRQHGYSISFQQNMMSIMPTQSFQILSHIPLKLEKTDFVHNEYLFKEISENRIFQNLSNRISNTRLLMETIPCNSPPLYYQSVENPVYAVVKENTNNDYLVSKKLLNQSTIEGQLTDVSKIRMELPLVFVKKRTVNPLFQYKKLDSMIYRKIKFVNDKNVKLDATSFRSNNRKDQTSNSKTKVNYKTPSKYFKQKCLSYNCQIYKTKFFKVDSITNFKLKLIQKYKKSTNTNIQRRDLQTETRRSKISLKNFKISSKLLSDRCKGKNAIQKCELFKKSNSSCNKPNCIALKSDSKRNEPKHLPQNVGINEQNIQCTNCDDSFFPKVDAQRSIKKDKCIIPVTAEYLNDVANYLLFNDEYDQGKFSNVVNQKIDGWIHLKISMLTIIRKALLILNDTSKEFKCI